MLVGGADANVNGGCFHLLSSSCLSNKVGGCPWLAVGEARLRRRRSLSGAKMPMFLQTSSSSSCAISGLASSRNRWITLRGSAVPLRVAPLDCGSEPASAAPSSVLGSSTCPQAK